MSRRAAVLEGYRVPDLTNPINPLDAQRMVSEERMHDKSLNQQKQQQQLENKAARDKALDDPYKLNNETSGTIYDPTGLKATQDLKTKMTEYANANRNKQPEEIKAMFAPQANTIAQYYSKAAIIKKNTDNFRKQLKALGFSFDWSREINTTDPKYYKWTQWIFLQLYKKGLAYQSFEPINWCPSLRKRNVSSA